MLRSCESCGEPIPAERLEAIPSTTTCVHCSTVKPRRGYMIPHAAKGTAAALVTVDTNDTEALRLAQRAHGRRR